MVMLFVAGKPVGSLEQNSDQMRSRVESGQSFEFRSESGRGLGIFQPAKEQIVPWEPDLTAEELRRMKAVDGGMSLAEFWRRMGVQ